MIKVLNWRFASLLFLGFCALMSLTYFERLLPSEVFNSPDEAANYWFAKEYAKSGEPIFLDGRNELSQGLTGMRATRAVGEKSVPGSFLGLPILAGSVGEIFGLNAMPYTSFIFMTFGLLAFWGITWRATKSTLWSTLAFLGVWLLPPTLFFGSKPFFHNALFLSLVVLAVWFMIEAVWQKRKSVELIFLAAGGLFFGLATIVRTNELVWLWPLAFLATIISRVIFCRKQDDWPILRFPKKMWRIASGSILALVGFIIPLLWLFATNWQLYGQIFSFGNYAPDFGEKLLTQPLPLLQQLIMPFGFHLGHIKEIWADYFLVWLWPVSVLIYLSLLYLLSLWPKLSKLWRWSIIIYLAVSLWLVALYGSWEFFDHPVLRLRTIATSYVRYWWPIWFFGWLFVAKAGALIYEIKLVKNKFVKFISLFCFLVLIIFYGLWSIKTVYLSQPDGLLVNQNVYAELKNLRDHVEKTTPPDAIILAATMDKAIWPKRQVIYKLNNEQDVATVGRLLKQGLKIYELQMTYSDKLFKEVNDARIKSAGWRLLPPLWQISAWSLYPMALVNK